MPVAVSFFLHYGLAVLFVWVMAEQLGVPIPSIPLLITAGTLSATSSHAYGQHLSIWLMLLSVMAACAVSDTIWYHLGRRFGQAVIRMLCRFSLETDTCVRRTQNIFEKRGPVALLFAKFMPGLNTVAAPIAGESNMPYSQFIVWDMAGAALWAGTFLLAGRFFGDALKRHPELWQWVGRFAGAMFVAAILGFLLYRLIKQRRFLTQVRNARLGPEELKEMMDAGKDLFIVDLRHPLDYLPDPRTIPGAIHVLPDELMKRRHEIPRDKDIVLFCTCPSEQTSGRVALQMRKAGIYRVRPLHGGYEGWRDRGFPLIPMTEATPLAESKPAESAIVQIAQS
jgi:membrane protein DedA with SNARE-associated domain/rhodanese-related sulfurtransferase